jgi:hypothetical protein
MCHNFFNRFYDYDVVAEGKKSMHNDYKMNHTYGILLEELKDVFFIQLIA